mmetsp:Transcript_889/g.1706  ORF Transcript_889/g.1706 Transcript_889/m.1706 type:complete len:253 (+) Transcript_889:10-768(+)
MPILTRKNNLRLKKYWEKVLLKNITLDTNGPVKLYPIKNSDFTPYQNNGGTVLALAKNDYCIVASDTRFSAGFALPTRNSNRVIKISSNILLATAGMQADLLVLQEEVKKKADYYKKKNEKNFSVLNCAFYLSSLLYSRRFFPFFAFNILTGMDTNGEGMNFSFDAIGSFEKSSASCKGKGEQLIQSLLDSQTSFHTHSKDTKTKELTNQIALIKNYFIKAAQRGISIGDGLQIFILTKKGVLIENNILRED